MFLYFRTHGAEVAQHGQRRRTEAPIPQGFVGSNPTLRTIDLKISLRTNGSFVLFSVCEVFLTYIVNHWFGVIFLVLEEGNTALTHHLPAHFEGNCILASATATRCRLVEAAPSSRTPKTENF
jgi:hypothetical protein